MRTSFEVIYIVRGERRSGIQFHTSLERAIESLTECVRTDFPEAEIVDIRRCPDPRIKQLLDSAVEVA
jgi:hypothetical protein